MSKTEFARLDKETWAEIGVEAGWISKESLEFEDIIIRPIAGCSSGRIFCPLLSIRLGEMDWKQIMKELDNRTHRLNPATQIPKRETNNHRITR